MPGVMVDCQSGQAWSNGKSEDMELQRPPVAGNRGFDSGDQ